MFTMRLYADANFSPREYQLSRYMFVYTQRLHHRSQSHLLRSKQFIFRKTVLINDWHETFARRCRSEIAEFLAAFFRLNLRFCLYDAKIIVQTLLRKRVIFLLIRFCLYLARWFMYLLVSEENSRSKSFRDRASGMEPYLIPFDPIPSS